MLARFSVDGSCVVVVNERELFRIAGAQEIHLRGLLRVRFEFGPDIARACTRALYSVHHGQRWTARESAEPALARAEEEAAQYARATVRARVRG